MFTLCKKRKDKWPLVKQGRLETSGDLPAAEAIYHSNCHLKFATIGSVIDSAEEGNSQTSNIGGRPIDSGVK